ncbi:hypothetical protein ACE1CB_32390 [Aerosakkonema sp. BLCC-F2]
MKLFVPLDSSAIVVSDTGWIDILELGLRTVGHTGTNASGDIDLCKE